MFWTFVEPAQLRGGEIVIEGKKAHHLGRVLRIRVGERGVAVVNGREHVVEVVQIEGNRVVGKIDEVRPVRNEPLIAVTLLQSLLPNPDFDAVIEGATAVGISRLVAIQATRSITRAGADRHARWQTIAESAAEQSHRGRVPEIAGPMPLPEALQQSKTVLLVLDPRATTPLSAAAAAITSVTLAVGPEGGWTDEEVRAMDRAGGTRVSLGPRILRARLAPVVATAILVHQS
ncbi:MAG: 16S rRNA (uracil(1498)-N(3))-methyltransferase [Candidatus Dormibacteraeota bacterium]|nr:16S rRNA (uracil(1498)-N(3))-methyltransferase [Candidatus Dormibacteraeota bacterium]